MLILKRWSQRTLMRARHNAPPVLADCFSNCLIKEDAPRAQASWPWVWGAELDKVNRAQLFIAYSNNSCCMGERAIFVEERRLGTFWDFKSRHLGGKHCKKCESCMTMKDRYIWMHIYASTYYCCIEEQTWWFKSLRENLTCWRPHLSLLAHCQV